MADAPRYQHGRACTRWGPGARGGRGGAGRKRPARPFRGRHAGARAAQRSGAGAAPGSAPRGARGWQASRTRLTRFCGRCAGWALSAPGAPHGTPGARRVPCGAGGGLAGVLGCLRASYGHCPACVCVWGACVQRLGCGALLTVLRSGSQGGEVSKRSPASAIHCSAALSGAPGSNQCRMSFMWARRGCGQGNGPVVYLRAASDSLLRRVSATRCPAELCRARVPAGSRGSQKAW